MTNQINATPVTTDADLHVGADGQPYEFRECGDDVWAVPAGSKARPGRWLGYARADDAATLPGRMRLGDGRTVQLIERVGDDFLCRVV